MACDGPPFSMIQGSLDLDPFSERASMKPQLALRFKPPLGNHDLFSVSLFNDAAACAAV